MNDYMNAKRCTYEKKHSYCRDSGGLAADLIFLTPIVPKSSRNKHSVCIACCENHPGSVFSDFATAKMSAHQTTTLKQMIKHMFFWKQQKS